MNNHILYLAVILSTVFLYSCGSSSTPDFSAACEYKTYEGTAEITVVQKSSAQGRACDNPVDIIYNFTPDDPNDVNNYVHKDFADNNIICQGIWCGGLAIYVDSIVPNPNTGLIKITQEYYIPVSQEWADQMGLYKNSIHRAQRIEQVAGGNCPTVSFEWPDITSTLEAMTEEQRLAVPDCEAE